MRYIVVLIVGFFFIYASPAHAKWAKVGSDNFILTGRVLQKNAEFKDALDPVVQQEIVEKNRPEQDAYINKQRAELENNPPEFVYEDGKFVRDDSHLNTGQDYNQDLARARTLLNTLNWENASTAKRTYERLLKNYGANAEIHVALAKIYLEMSNLDASQDHAQKALKLEPVNKDANYLAGKVIMIENNYGRATPSDIARAQTYLQNYLQSGDEIDAHFFFVMATSLISDDMSPKDQSTLSITKCLNAYTSPDDMDRVLVLAGYLAQMEKHVDALEAVGSVLASTKDIHIRTQAYELQKQLTDYLAYKNQYQLLYGK